METSLLGTGDLPPDDRESITAYRRQSADGPARPRAGSGRAARHISRLQRASAVLIAGACVFAAAWYVPGLVAADSRSLTGTVTSDGLLYLNFASTGRVAKVAVHVGQAVRAGQLLAAETAPAAVAIVTADRAAIAADQAQLAAARAGGAAIEVAAAHAQLARNKAQLAMDRAALVGTRIIAPSAGMVVAVNGQAGDTADAQGVRNYSFQPAAVPVTQQPEFSLLPEGPQSSVQAAGSAAALALPVIALSTSSAWHVTVLVPESMFSSIRPGQPATVSVPAAGIAALPGRVQEILATPVVTAQGMAYEALVSISDRRVRSPADGMSADVQLSS